MPEEIVKTEVISSDKDGTLEKVYFKKRPKAVTNEEGVSEQKMVQPWEIRATGRKVQELRGAFKDSGPEMMHEGYKEWQANGGDLKITKPDGSVDTIRADKEELYRQQPGFCQARVRPGMTIDGFGEMKRRGLTRFKASYKDGVRTVLEER